MRVNPSARPGAAETLAARRTEALLPTEGEQHQCEGILGVEDDQGTRESLVGLLKDEGCPAATAPDGLEALHYVAGHPLPCVILLDLMMPVMDG